jgi:hypothetical protein
MVTPELGRAKNDRLREQIGACCRSLVPVRRASIRRLNSDRWPYALGHCEQSSLDSVLLNFWAPRGHDLGTGWAPRPAPSFGHGEARRAGKTFALHGHRSVWAPAKMVQVLDLARLRRFERPTPAFGGQYSIQLSYRRLWAQILAREMVRRLPSEGSTLSS